MKIICLHGTGSNNEIFERQTASLRAHLSDLSFEFLEGTVPHLEGSWSRHYQTVLSSAGQNNVLYAYFKLLDMQSMLDAEIGLLELLHHEDPPFDGVLAYSAGCALAAQAILRNTNNTDRPLFKFAVFVNGLTPARTFSLDEVVGVSEHQPDDCGILLREEAFQQLSLIEKLRLEGTPCAAEQIAKGYLADKEQVNGLRAMTFAGGSSFLSDGEVGFMQFNPRHHSICIPTLHVWDPAASRHFGRGLLELCDPKLAREYRHHEAHEFPRGYHETLAIARLTKDVADIAD